MAFSKRQLPPNFAQQILENQIEFKLSDRPSPQVIHKLCQLYSIGVEYYECIKSHKYLYFKKKMEELFTKEVFTAPEVKEEDESPIKQKLRSKNEEERIEAIMIRDKQKKMEKEVAESIGGGAKKQAQKIIKQVGESEKKLTSKVRATLANQDQALQQKLRQRKKKTFGKSFSAYGLSDGAQTKESLNDRQPFSGKDVIEPLTVSFEGIIGLSQEEKMDELLLRKGSMLARGRMTSLRSFHK